MSTLYLGGALFRTGVGSLPGWGLRVSGARIEAVLPDDVLLADRVSGDEVVDVRGGLISPGFIDAHYHPTIGGLDLNACDLTPATNAEECLAIVAAYAAAHPEREWIVGAGWQVPWFPGGLSTAAMLDAVVPDRPVLLANADHHGHWANSAALRIGGVSATTPDPTGGRIERDAAGEPTGVLHEAASDLVGEHLPPITEDAIDEALASGQRHALSYGITGWQDALVGRSGITADNLGAYLRARAAGTLKARVRLALWWQRDRGLEQIEDHVTRRALAAEAGLDASSIKLMVDGVAENFTAAISRPYLDPCGHVTNNSGHSFISAEMLKEAVAALDAEGFQCHFHALGDRAVTEALDAVEYALERNGLWGNRHHLAHLQMVQIRDTSRFARLGAAANLQPLWAQAEEQMIEHTLPYLDASLRDRQYPFGDLLAAGVTLAAGSDWPVSSADPLAGMQVAVTRQYVTELDPLLPEQALPLERAWTAYTAGSAWVNHLDHETGALVPGHLADLAILDGDPFAGPPHEISSHRVVRTVVGGETVHEA
ncbi:MAG: amidohydrolase [Nocardioides sp.]